MESNDKKSMARSASESEIQRGRSGKTGGDRHRGRSRSPTPSLTSQRTSQQTKSATLPRTSTSKHSKTDERKASSNMKSKFFSPFLRVRERVRPLECFIQKVVRQVVNRTPIGRKRAEQRTRPAYRRNSFSSPSGPTHKLSKDKMPGSTGLRNLGNTCYINAIIQCLSKTDILAEYFCCDQYKADLARNNKINARTYGTRGELTENLALLFKSLWVCEYMLEVSSQFKSCVSKYGPQYRGSSQHDAQEFLVWLLDKVHEDLNIASKKKYRSNKSSYGRPDDIVAAEALANHTRCNSSFVQDLFLAQYQSSLTCAKCKRQSNNFDPFLCVSLPLPQRADRPVYVTIVYLDAQPKQVKLGVNVNINATVKELRSELSLQTKIPPKQFLMTELYYDGFYRTFLDDQSLSIVHETDNIYCIEVPPASDKLLIIASNRLGVGTKGRKFGSPLVLQLSRQASYQKLQDAILAKLAPCLKDGVTSKRMGVLFNIRVVDGIAGKSYLSHDDDHPLFVETVDRALEACAGNAPHHIKVILEWDPDTKQVVFSNVEDVIEEHASVQQLKGRYQKQLSATLSECFDLYTEEEKLDDKNTWLCPNCKRLPHGTTKRLSLWTLPDILVIHLKRFKQLTSQRVKLSTLVDYPVYGLDMTKQVATRLDGANGPHNQWSPWKRKYRSTSNPDDTTYDLYAVTNHIGSLSSGHYTAMCKNMADCQWYQYDDQRVTPITEKDVVNKAAYILFYQRRSLSQTGSAHGGAGVSVQRHWVQRMPEFRYRPPTKSQSVGTLDDKRRILESGATTLGRSFVRQTTSSSNLLTPSQKSGNKPDRSSMISTGTESSDTHETTI